MTKSSCTTRHFSRNLNCGRRPHSAANYTPSDRPLFLVRFHRLAFCPRNLSFWSPMQNDLLQILAVVQKLRTVLQRVLRRSMSLGVYSSASATRLSRTAPNSLVSPAYRPARTQRWKHRHRCVCRSHRLRKRQYPYLRKMLLRRGSRDRSNDLRESTLSADTFLAYCGTYGRL